MILKNWKHLLKKRSKKTILVLGVIGLLGKLLTLGFCYFVVSACYKASAYQPKRQLVAHTPPEELKNIQIEEKTGEFIDTNLTFVDEKGNKVLLKKYFSHRPVLLTIVYYGCPHLCTLHLNGLSEALKSLPQSFKKQFEWVVLSMDHKETPRLAHKKKKNYLSFARFPAEHVHFLTGSKKNISLLSRSVGFRFYWDNSQKIYAHLPVAYVLTPKAKISRYLYGVEFAPQTLKLSLVEASLGRIGGVIDRVLLFCYQFDPKRGRYSWYAYNIMRAGGALTVLLLLGFLLPFWLREKSRK